METHELVDPWLPEDHVSRKLLKRRDLIVRVWLERVRAELPPLKDERSAWLRDGVPSFLTQLAQRLALRREQAGRPSLDELGSEQACQRPVSSEYTLERMLDELAILREVLIEQLERDTRLALPERKLIHRGLDESLRQAATAFARAASLGARERELLAAIIEALPVGVVVVESLHGEVIMRNPRAPLLPLSISRKQERADRPYLVREHPLARAIHKGETTVKEKLTYQSASGEPTYYCVSARPIRDPQGNVLAAICVFEEAPG